jgi:[acyl-carrier-protein] S-malonyltransferase
MSALLFAGQGAQYPGMARVPCATSAAVRALFARAEEQTGLPLRELCVDAPAERLARTELTQPAIFMTAVANLIMLRERAGPGAPAAVAGHSAGQIAALHAAGVLGFEDALGLVCERGAAMATAPAGGMVAVLGLPVADVERVCAGITVGVAELAAINSEDHTTIAASGDALEAVLAAASGAGAARAVRLAVAVPAHSSLMREAGERFARAVRQVSFARPRCQVALCSRAVLTGDPDEIADELADTHMCAPVRWNETLDALHRSGVRPMVDVGPGEFLSRQVARRYRDVEVVTTAAAVA